MHMHMHMHMCMCMRMRTSPTPPEHDLKPFPPAEAVGYAQRFSVIHNRFQRIHWRFHIACQL
jgi:hypothetical protein